jgi:hypothetical protein
VLVSVHSENSNDTKRAKEIFERAGADDISTSSEASVPDAPRTDRPRERGTTSTY